MKQNEIKDFHKVPKGSWRKYGEHRSLVWWRCGDEVLIKQMLTVRHDSKRESDLARVKLRPGVQNTILQERNVPDNLIWV